MLIKRLLLILASSGAIGFYVSGVAREDALKAVVLPESELLKSYFSADLIPYCAVELSSLYKENECYRSEEETDEDVGFKIIHNRFLKNINRLEEFGGEYNKLPKDNYAIYHEAVCSLGIVRSCALDQILRQDDVDVSVSSIAYLISGEAREYHEVLDKVYPEKYDSKDYNHFYRVLNSGIKLLSEEAKRNQ